eukprot:763930-Hanusia_phi.AAC.5
MSASQIGRRARAGETNLSIMSKQDESNANASEQPTTSFAPAFGRKEGRLPAAILHVIAIERKRATKVYRRGLQNASIRIFRLKTCSRAFFEWKVLIFMKKNIALVPNQSPTLCQISYQISSLVADAQGILSGFAEDLNNESLLLENSHSSSHDRTMYIQVNSPYSNTRSKESPVGCMDRKRDEVKKDSFRDSSYPILEDLEEELLMYDLREISTKKSKKRMSNIDLHCIEGDLLYIIFQLADCIDLVKFVTETLSLSQSSVTHESALNHRIVERSSAMPDSSATWNTRDSKDFVLPEHFGLNDEDTISSAAIRDQAKAQRQGDQLSESQIRFFMAELERKDREITVLQNEMKTKDEKIRWLNEEVRKTKEIMNGKNVFFSKKIEMLNKDLSKQAEKLMQKYEEIELVNQALKNEENNSRSMQRMIDDAVENARFLERRIGEENEKGLKAVHDLNCSLDEEKRKVTEMISNIMREREVSFQSIMLCRKAAEEISLLIGELWDIDHICFEMKREFAKDQSKLKLLDSISESIFDRLERLEWSMDEFFERVNAFRSKEKKHDFEKKSLKLRIDELQGSLQDKDSKMMSLLEDLSSSKRQIEKLNDVKDEELEGLWRAHRRLEDEHTDLEKQLEAVRKEREVFRNDMRHLESEKRTLEHELEARNSKLTQLSSMIRDKTSIEDRERSSIETKRRNLVEACSKMQRTCNEALQKSKRLEFQNAVLETAIKTSARDWGSESCFILMQIPKTNNLNSSSGICQMKKKIELLLCESLPARPESLKVSEFAWDSHTPTDEIPIVESKFHDLVTLRLTIISSSQTSAFRDEKKNRYGGMRTSSPSF